MKKYIITLVILLVAIGGWVYMRGEAPAQIVENPAGTPSGNPIVTFDQCVEAGNPVMESLPEQCRTEDGVHFVNWRATDQMCIQVITPAKNPETGEVRDFPTPCDVPQNWESNI